MVPLLLLAACAEPDVPLPWSAPPEQPLDLRVTVRPLHVALLQPITVTLDRYRADGVEVSFQPVVEDERFVTDRITKAEERAFGDGWVQRTELVLLPVAGPGELQVPAFAAETVVAAGEEPQVATTDEVTITVDSALQGEHGSGIEAPGGPFAARTNWWLWGGGAAALLLAGAALARWFARRRRAPDDPLTVAVPAHVRALRELQRWRGAPRGTPAEVAAFYVGVSQVLRVYLEERFGLHAPERTTEEFLRDLESADTLARAHRAELERFLQQCDLVKFAAVVPGEEEHQRTFELAEAFIESTRADRIEREAATARPSEVPA